MATRVALGTQASRCPPARPRPGAATSPRRRRQSEREIRSVLAVRDSGEAPCVHVADLIAQHLADIERRMAALRTTRTALRTLAHCAAAATDPSTSAEADICRIITPCDNGGLSPQE
ncbi:MerR family DNA-binding protein [Streptomyces sp. NPDC056309]|uniref:MerR family DNA-binding protein n=1 Tax=unclassified Streptomyces TaxID=2593676 RepID=UPI0035D55D3C